jgi:hypothetical protein
MPRIPTRLALAALLAASAPPAAAEEEKEKPRPAAREELEAVEATIARAVDRVSLPHAARLLGRVESARGYRLPGYGVVLLLTPRTLPGGDGQIYVLRGAPKHRRLRVLTPAPGEAAPVAEEEDIETFERQVLVLQQEAEAARRAAEEEMERIVRDVRVRVAPPSAVHVEMVSPAQAPEPPEPPEPPGPAEAPLPAAPPPWKFWFETGAPVENRSPERVIADVRGALVEALATGSVRVGGLAGDERVTVAVDFVPGGIFAAQARPEKTLVVSARAKDVDARARGAITKEELRKRVEVTEY